MKKLIKPKALNPNDTIAAISLSSGCTSLFPHRFEQGIQQIKESFGLNVIPTTHALNSVDEIYNHPEWRLNDLMDALLDENIKAILCNIGGSDTIRLLSLMNEKHFEIIKTHPKIFLGLSDNTTNHFMFYKAGVSSFYGPSLLFGYAENGGIPEIMIQNTKKTLFEAKPIGILPESKEFIIDHVEWCGKNQPKRPRIPSTPWRYIQGEKTTQGPLIGGCTDALMTMLVGTPLWPNKKEFEGAILFLENSEEKPSIDTIIYWLRNLGAQGILSVLNGILFARPGNDEFASEAEKIKWLTTYPEYDKAILKVLKEYNRTDMPVVTNMDFGHTLPQLILPYGAQTEINPNKKTVSILEAGTTA